MQYIGEPRIGWRITTEQIHALTYKSMQEKGFESIQKFLCSILNLPEFENRLDFNCEYYGTDADVLIGLNLERVQGDPRLEQEIPRDLFERIDIAKNMLSELFGFPFGDPILVYNTINPK